MKLEEERGGREGEREKRQRESQRLTYWREKKQIGLSPRQQQSWCVSDALGNGMGWQWKEKRSRSNSAAGLCEGLLSRQSRAFKCVQEGRLYEIWRGNTITFLRWICDCGRRSFWGEFKSTAMREQDFGSGENLSYVVYTKLKRKYPVERRVCGDYAFCFDISGQQSKHSVIKWMPVQISIVFLSEEKCVNDCVLNDYPFIVLDMSDTLLWKIPANLGKSCFLNLKQKSRDVQTLTQLNSRLVYRVHVVLQMIEYVNETRRPSFPRTFLL